jgi:hypothetical protein
MNTSTRLLPSLIQCCDCCSALLDDTSQATTLTAARGCRVCALLLRQVCYDGRSEENADINIVRQGAALREVRKEATGVRLLRLCRDTGPSLTPYVQARNNTDPYIQRR